VKDDLDSNFLTDTFNLFKIQLFIYVNYVGINDSLVLKTDTQETEKILTRQFLLIKRVQACIHSSWVDTWAQNGWQWLLLISLTQLYLPLTWDLSSLKVHNPSQLAKRLRGWVRAHSLVGSFHGDGAVQESRRKKQGPFKQCKSPKMATWGILSNLRGWHILW
jgi:hypothetical protein